MIWTDFHFFSQSLGIQTAVYVLLPEHAQMEALRHRFVFCSGKSFSLFRNLCNFEILLFAESRSCCSSSAGRSAW